MNSYTDSLDWCNASTLINQSRSILISSHVNPDGDAIGSMLALSLCLRQLGKQVDVVVDGGLPPSFRFLVGSETIGDTPVTGSWDLFVSLDSSDEPRTGDSGRYGRANSSKVLNIDHHVTNTYFGDVQLVNTTAVSTTEVIYRWFAWQEIEITIPVAQALLTGLTTDTQGFRTDNVTSETLYIAEQLMKIGASLTLIIKQTLNRRSYSSVLLWQRVFPKIQLVDSVIYVSIRQSDWTETGLPPNNDSGLVNFLIQVNEAKIAALFSEIAVNEIKVEFRSVAGYDVATLASQMGGGGHRQASGATLYCNLDEAIARVVPLLCSTAEA